MEKKLNINDVKKVAKEKKAVKEKIQFGKPGSLEAMIEPEKIEILKHPARKKVIIGAKNTGKSLPVTMKKFADMENDPNASWLTLQKYSTGSTKRQSRSDNQAYINIKRKGFKFGKDGKTEYMIKDQSFFIRETDKRNKLNNQSNEYSSFENADGIAGSVPSNGGYYAGAHFEEPAQQSDALKGKTINRKTWSQGYKMIEDTLERSAETYKEMTDGYHPVIPFQIYITLNDWDEDFPESVDADHYFPRRSFLTWSLGYDYFAIKNEFESEIDGFNPVPGLVKWVNEKMPNGLSRWENIKKSVLVNHTKSIYIDKDDFGKKIDTLYVRMHKFANPILRNNKEQRQKTFDDMFNALITGSSSELARVFGMVNDDMDEYERLFNTENFQPIDTYEKLNEPGRKVLGFSIGWDHDANRGPVGTPVTLSAISVMERDPNNRLQFRERLYDWKVMVHHQVGIKGYGKGVRGEKTEKYHEQMIKISLDMKQLYTRGLELRQGCKILTDDDDGTYSNKLYRVLREHGFSNVRPIKNKKGAINNKNRDGYGREHRSKLLESAIDVEDLLIDKSNTEFIKWFKLVPAEQLPGGGKKYSTKGKWGTRMKDFADSAMYGIWEYRLQLYFDVFGLECNQPPR